ncbi:DUF1559 family PulG-like putative transporter [Tuwongella immobilis]|uniref:DUF1559 domain-containing protein n=1 Tax=Tuwongella immobilis TaxID=692036 RepID=A0A6C2YUL3_9BACT|nr:DUF1559 domain-containing protein [Tuwongella immobilis]VIP04605.1 Protein containing DUF1559 OS=Rhodopirellula maiorica SM1 GN=RMSM_02894 PE=4 SV=1: SBP_bac_10 [Tuwongella immobilis]VTS06571.1 Protein containing DUF1559 OS=Rhodopirellula maiorica SM1 GN=RMSM_02894 PE=4 SV=1: SBP_bac_10 [Tuwongella immobilis]
MESRSCRIVGIALAIGMLLQSGARAGGLEYISGQSLGFMHMRATDMWNSPSMELVRNVVLKAGREAISAYDNRFAPKPSSIREVTMVVLPSDDPKNREGFDLVVIVTTATPINPMAAMRTLAADAKPIRGDMPLFSSQEWESLFAFPNRTTMLVGPGRAVRLALAKQAPMGELADAVKAAESQMMTMSIRGSLIETVAAAMMPPVGMPARQIPGDAPPKAPEPMALPEWVKSLRQITLTLNETKQIDVKLTTRFADAESAQTAETAIRMAQKMAAAQMGEAKREFVEMLSNLPVKDGITPLSELPKALASAMALGSINELSQKVAEFPIDVTGSEIRAAITLPGGKSGTVVMTTALAAGFLLPAVQKTRAAAQSMAMSNNFKQVGLAMHNYESAYGYFPAAAIRDAKGKPLLSWRVAILPFIEQDNLYRQFKLDEPWDSEHNKKLIPLMPSIYLHPMRPETENGKTHVCVFVGDASTMKGIKVATLFSDPRGNRITNVTDGTSNSFMVAEARDPVIWTRPDMELEVQPGKPLPKLGGGMPGKILVGFADGSVRWILDNVSDDVLRQYIGINDGIPAPELK